MPSLLFNPCCLFSFFRICRWTAILCCTHLKNCARSTATCVRLLDVHGKHYSGCGCGCLVQLDRFVLSIDSRLTQFLARVTWHSATNINNFRSRRGIPVHLGNKYLSVSDFIASNDLDLFCLTESWHKDSSDVAVLRSIPAGYRCIDVPREAPVSARASRGFNPDAAPRGGGIILYFRDHFVVKKIDVVVGLKTFEYVCVSLSTPRGPVTVVIYRPGSIEPDASFLQEFSSLLEALATYNSQLVITGDLNIHFEDPTNNATIQVNRVLSSSCARSACRRTYTWPWWYSGCRHHKVGLQHLWSSRWSSGPLWPWSGILSNSFCHSGCTSLHFSAGSWVEKAGPWCFSFGSTVWSALPVGWTLSWDVSRATIPTLQWNVGDNSGQVHSTSRGQVKSLLLHTMVRQWVPFYQKACASTRASLPSDKVGSGQAGMDYWSSWQAPLLQGKGKPILGKHRQLECSRFQEALALCLYDARKACQAAIFTSAFLRLWLPHVSGKEGGCRSLCNCWCTTSGFLAPLIAASTHSRFAPRKWLNEQSRLHLRSAVSWIRLLPSSSRPVKACLDILSPFITLMCNASIQEGTLPASQKEAIVIPALKKFGLDTHDMKNYRPISNLSFMSKVVEKLIFEQLSVYLVENKLFPKLQSGFRRYHSTESAVLRVLSDIYSDCWPWRCCTARTPWRQCRIWHGWPLYPAGETVYVFRFERTSLRVVRLVHLWPISIRAVGGYFITQGTGPFRYSSRIGTRANPVRPLYRRCCQDCRIIRAQGSPVCRRHSNLRFQQCLTIGRAIRTSPSCHWQG